MDEEDQRRRDPHHQVPVAPPSVAAADRARKVGRGIVTGSRVTARGLRSLGRGTARASRFTMIQARRASEAEGAGESGLSRLIQMHVFNTAGDAAVAISLAGSLFFQVPSGEARDQVALFLGLTMLPFAIVAPLIGPFLDRFAHGRRWAIGATMAVRAFLCWILASSVEQRLGAGLRRCPRGARLVQGVRRHAGRRRTPPAPARLHPGQGQRPGLAVGHRRCDGLRADRRAGVAARPGVVAALRRACSSSSRRSARSGCRRRSTPARARASCRGAARRAAGRRRGRLRTRIPGPVAFALRANCGPWFLGGFLLMFVAFVLRNPDVRPDSSLRRRRDDRHRGRCGRAGPHPRHAGRLAAAPDHPRAGGGDGAARRCRGRAAGRTLLRRAGPLALLGLVAGLAQALAKFSLDATIQRDIPAKVQASAFGRSDTTCQLAWVLGGLRRHRPPARPAAAGAHRRLPRGRLVDGRTCCRPRRAGAGAGGSAAQARARQADIDTQPMPVERRP